MQVIDQIINIFKKNKLSISLFMLLVLLLIFCVLKKFIKFGNIEGATTMAEKEASAESSINSNSNSDEDKDSADAAGCGEGGGCEDIDTEPVAPMKKHL